MVYPLIPSGERSWTRAAHHILQLKGVIMAKKRVFASFDYDHDLDLKNAFIGQAALDDSPFDVIDMSLKEAAPAADWEAKARAAIKRSDFVVVLLGASTHSASGVKKEVKMANEEGIARFQLEPQDKIRTAVAGAGVKYNWTWPRLKELLS